jgi:hypothetical protein
MYSYMHRSIYRYSCSYWHRYGIILIVACVPVPVQLSVLLTERKILPAYYQHVNQFPDTLLVRFYGLHRGTVYISDSFSHFSFHICLLVQFAIHHKMRQYAAIDCAQ